VGCLGLKPCAGVRHCHATPSLSRRSGGVIPSVDLCPDGLAPRGLGVAAQAARARAEAAGTHATPRASALATPRWQVPTPRVAPPRWHHAACASHGRAPRTRGRTHATHPQRRRRSYGGSLGWTVCTASSGRDQVRSRRASTASPPSRSTACAGEEKRSAPWSTCRPDRVAQCQLSNPHLGYYPLS
jgi:hypothetical protein